MKKSPFLAAAVSIVLSQLPGSTDQRSLSSPQEIRQISDVPDTVLQFVKTHRRQCKQLYDSFSGKLPPKDFVQIAKTDLQNTLPFGIWDCNGQKLMIAADTENITLKMGSFIQDETGRVLVQEKGKVREALENEVKKFHALVGKLLHRN